MPFSPSACSRRRCVADSSYPAATYTMTSFDFCSRLRFSDSVFDEALSMLDVTLREAN